MQLRYPRKIQILSSEVKVTYDRKMFGGEFSWADETMMIGTGQSESEIFGVILHECSEYIHCMMSTRFIGLGTTGDYRFVMDHAEFQNHSMVLSTVIRQFIR